MNTKDVKNFYKVFITWKKAYTIRDNIIYWIENEPYEKRIISSWNQIIGKYII